MELIRLTITVITQKGNKVRYGIFWCGYCKQEVERQLGNGKRNKSCGCQKYSEERDKKISESLKNKKRESFTDEHRQNLSESLKGKKRTEEQIKNISEGHKGQKPWNKGLKGWNSGKDNPFYGKSHSEESKQIIKEKLTGRKLEEEHKKNIGKSIQGGNHPNWQNGKSFEIYPKEFKQIKKFILERDNYKCQYPNCTEVHDRLHVHHIDYDKKNNNPENLITLGTSCHSKTNGKNNREYWAKFYQKIMGDLCQN